MLFPVSSSFIPCIRSSAFLEILKSRSGSLPTALLNSVLTPEHEEPVLARRKIAALNFLRPDGAARPSGDQASGDQCLSLRT